MSLCCERYGVVVVVVIHFIMLCEIWCGGGSGDTCHYVVRDMVW
jgi:hypothetical protein